jgi:DNA-binding transcriptional regulator WhiA
MCNQSEPIENIEIVNNDIAELNRLAKSASSAITYIKAVDDAEDIAARALSLRSASRKAVIVQVPNQCGLREIYDEVELSGHRLNDGMYRVTGITEDLATGKTTMELFR